MKKENESNEETVLPSELEPAFATETAPATERVEKEPIEVKPPEEVEPAEKKVYVGTGVSWAILFGVLLIAFIAILAAQNTAPVKVNLLFWELEAPLISVILGVAAVTVVIDELIGVIVRLRRRRRLRQRDELRELKKGKQ